MSTVAEIKEAISQLPEGEWQKIRDWMNAREDAREFTDDGLDIKEVQAKVAEARRGEYHHVDSKEEIRKIMAGLE